MTGQYSKKNEKIFLLVVSLVFISLSIFILKDLLTVIVWSFLLAYILYPIHKRFEEKFKNSKISASLTLSFGIIFVFLPLLIFFYFLILNIISIAGQFRPYIQEPELINELISDYLGRFFDTTFIDSINFGTYIQMGVDYLISFVGDFFAALPWLFLSTFIILFITFFLLRDNAKIFEGFNDYIPLDFKKQEKIFNHIRINLKYLFRGYFLTSLIQTGVAFIGYLVFGVPYILVITFLTFLVSLIPYLGTPMIYVPVGAIMIFTGSEAAGIALIIYGILVISTIDNVVRPYLMSGPDGLSSPLVFLGFIGGMLVFGLAGIILGPIILAITSLLLRYLKEDYKIEEVKHKEDI